MVTAVVPCRNEGRFIAAALESLLAGDYPHDRLEVLVVEGNSTDDTRARIARIAESHPIVRLVDNPSGLIPVAMNIGIRAAAGEVIIKIDAHAEYAPDYVSLCVQHLLSSGADNVGGVLDTRPASPGTVGRAIAAVLAHPFGSGNSLFRTGAAEPVWTDTAAFGCYRRDLFDRIGFYDERLVRSSDMDLNVRLRKAGGRVLLVPGIRATYFSRSTVGDFISRNVLDGFWALYPIRFGSRLMRPRHLLPLVCVLIALALAGLAASWPPALLVLAALVAMYGVLALAASVQLAARSGDWLQLPLAFVLFPLRHGPYGLGSGWGLIKGVVARATGSDGIKRFVDVLASGAGLIVLSPVLLLVVLAIFLEDRHGVLYRGRRIGRGGVPFDMLKFRTMRIDADRVGGTSTPADDPRITRVGAWLRQYKLDELPQLVNVLKGEMSLVGPRPQVAWAVDLYSPEERTLLSVRPGITDYASIRFANEAEILRGSSDPDRAYLELIAPEKIRLGLRYVRTRSLAIDVRIIAATVLAALGRDGEAWLDLEG